MIFGVQIFIFIFEFFLCGGKIWEFGHGQSCTTRS